MEVSSYVGLVITMEASAVFTDTLLKVVNGMGVALSGCDIIVVVENSEVLALKPLAAALQAFPPYDVLRNFLFEKWPTLDKS